MFIITTHVLVVQLRTEDTIKGVLKKNAVVIWFWGFTLAGVGAVLRLGSCFVLGSLPVGGQLWLIGRKHGG